MTPTRGFDFGPIEVLSFDCYGTLIDWEVGIVAGLRRVLGEAGARSSDDELLELYAAAEASVEAGDWRPYRNVLRRVLAAVCRPFGREPTETEAAAFAASVGAWPPFADSAAALARLRARYDLAVITNCDDDQFAASNRRLGEPFTWVVTAEQVRAYKPNPRIFSVALERIGRPAGSMMHVAQSRYHDHVPAERLGLATAWIDRRHRRRGSGATPPAHARPDVVVPDMATFADLALGR